MPRIQLASLTLVLALTSCNVKSIVHDGSEKKHSDAAIELDKSEMVKATLEIKAGEIKVRGGASKLMEAGFDAPSEWLPNVSYKNTSFRGDLRVEQPTSGPSFGESDNVWDLRFNDTVPLDIDARMGAGRADLKLGSLSLRSVSVKAGAGEVIVDLRGEPKRSYNVAVHGGVGSATVYLPMNAAISASASGGLGSIDTQGLSKRDGRWVNPDKEHSSVLVTVEVHGGIGEIKLIR